MSDPPYRDLRERTFEFVCRVVTFCRELSKEPGVVRQIAWQLADAATSTGSNLEEAKGAYSRRDFAAKNAIALKEIRETQYWLRIILHTHLAKEDAVQPLLAESRELTAILTATMRKLNPVSPTILLLLSIIVMALWHFRLYV